MAIHGACIFMTKEANNAAFLAQLGTVWARGLFLKLNKYSIAFALPRLLQSLFAIIKKLVQQKFCLSFVPEIRPLFEPLLLRRHVRLLLQISGTQGTAERMP